MAAYPVSKRGDAAQDAEKQAFGEELPREAGARGAECSADGGFAQATPGAGHEEVGDVGAPDEKHEANASEKTEEGGADFADRVGLKGKTETVKLPREARPPSLLSCAAAEFISDCAATSVAPLRRRPTTCRKAGPSACHGPTGMDSKTSTLGGTLASLGKMSRKSAGSTPITVERCRP